MKKLSRKILLSLAIVFSSLYMLPLPTLAREPIDGPDQQTPTTAPTRYGNSKEACPNFLGLTSWDCGVGEINDEASLKNNIWLIAANVATDIAIISAYLVLGYIIYGGYLYTFSAGDPGKVANGKKTLTQAFIGLAIVMSATLIMGSIRIALVGGNGNIGNCATGENACVSANELVTNLINWLITISGLVAAVFLVYGGISYTTSSGDPGKIQKAKQTILYALIGLGIVALSAAISAFVSNMIREANNNAYIKQSTISKEANETNTN